MAWAVIRWNDVAGLDHWFGGRLDAPPAGVVTLRQVHGTSVIDAAELRGDPTDGDALLTDRSGVRVGVWTADCVPVLLVARRVRAAAAVHSGWRGTAAGIVEAALAALRARHGVAAGDVEAALGPAIGGCCYEVGDDVRDAFQKSYGGIGVGAFDERGGRLMLDLRRFLEARLRSLGIASVDVVGPCTSCRPDVLHSYRRARGGGRQISTIGWR